VFGPYAAFQQSPVGQQVQVQVLDAAALKAATP